MLKVRAQQMEALTAARWEDFFDRAERHVRVRWPARVKGRHRGQLREIFDASATSAKHHGLMTERQIVCVFEATLLIGPSFGELTGSGWVSDVLRSRMLDADDRADLLLATATAMVRQGASANG